MFFLVTFCKIKVWIEILNFGTSACSQVTSLFYIWKALWKYGKKTAGRRRNCKCGDFVWAGVVNNKGGYAYPLLTRLTLPPHLTDKHSCPDYKLKGVKLYHKNQSSAVP